MLFRSHGGTVTADSAGEGLGSTFRVQLPMIGFAAQRAVQAAQDEALSLQGLHVLLVDDDADGREVLRRVLEDHGARVSAAGSAQAALAMLASEPVDVLVSDIGMPEMDGYELMRCVRQLPAPGNAAVPSIALTAFACGEDRMRALDAGFHVHLAKPVEPVVAVRAVAEVWRRGTAPA